MKEVIKERQGLYRQEFEHDNCGIGAVVNIKGKKTHDTVANALKIVEHLEHRAGKDAEGKTGDGVGIMLHIDRLKNEALPIGVSLVVSTILTIAVTALVIKYSTIWLQKRKERKEARHE